MTRLDHNRAISQLAAKTGATVTDVTKMTIWGNHSVTQYPDLFHAEVDGKNALRARRRPGVDRRHLHPDRRQARRGHHRGARRVVGRIGRQRRHRPHPLVGRSARPRATGSAWPSRATARYGVPEGLISSFPCTCTDGEYSIVQGLDIDDYSRGKIDASTAELAEERDAVRELGLI